MDVIIVESPNKISKITKILGGHYKVVASMGHIRDLPGKEIAVDLQTYKPEYVVTKKNVVSNLKKICSHAKCVFIATDPDREGEGIAMHIMQVLNLRYPKCRRMVFHEITPRAVKNALVHSQEGGTFDTNMSDAYQARRVIDRIVGYTVSPFLWKHVQGAKSAGRVQSVASKMVIEKEKAISDHKMEETFSIRGFFLCQEQEKYEIEAVLEQKPKDRDEALHVLHFCRDAVFNVKNLITETVQNAPPPPFKTSVLQQEAGKQLGLSPKNVMSIAQKLYEKGFITYHRTDTTTLSQYFIDMANEFILATYGEKYLSKKVSNNNKKGKPSKAKEQKTKEQASHEAIRPTKVNVIFLPGNANDLEKKLYRLIWIRAVGSLMAKEICERYRATIVLSNTDDYWFVATYLLTIFPGFKILYRDNNKKQQKKDAIKNEFVTRLKPGDQLFYQKIISTQGFIEPPKRYTESSLVKELENKGIGRPSTYASIIETIQKRNYVIKKASIPIPVECLVDTLEKNGKITSTKVKKTLGDKKYRLFPTEIGSKTTEFLNQNTATMMDYDFTCSLEKDLDSISEGKKKWKSVVKNIHEILTKELTLIPEPQKKTRQNCVVCTFENKPVEFFITRYGPCLKHDKKWYNLDSSYQSIEDIKERTAVAIIKSIRKSKAGIVSYDCSIDNIKGNLKILKGPYGHYLRFSPAKKGLKSQNFSISNEINKPVSDLTLGECLEYVEASKKYRKQKHPTHRD
jgi:DNA topoisomerase-1